MQEIQKKRVEEEMKEDPNPNTPGSKSMDKDVPYHFETAQPAH